MPSARLLLFLHLTVGLPSLSSTWKYLGPLPTGKTEFDADVAEAAGGVLALLSLGARARVQSELEPGGTVSWSTLKAANGGVVDVPTPPQLYDLVNALGDAAALEIAGWAASTLKIDAAANTTLSCRGVARAALVVRHEGGRVDVRPFAGDIYNSNWISSTFDVPQGSHTVLVRVRGRASSRFACSAVRRDGGAAALTIAGVLSTPDVWGERIAGGAVGVVIGAGLNDVSDLSCEVVGGKDFAARSTHALPLLRRVQSGGTLILPCSLRALRTDGRVPCGRAESIAVLLAVAGRVGGERVVSTPVSINLRCRAANESAIFTYTDVDGAATSAGVLAPLGGDACPARAAPVLLSLHGTGVSGGAQADAYKQKLDAEKEYTFGVRGAWVVAPDRFGAHNWEGVGLDSAFRARSALSAWLARGCGGVQVVDTRRVIFAGHSMGGHGAWLAAVSAPDDALAVSPSAGWLVKESYSDANAFSRWDASEPDTPPALTSVLLHAVRDQRADASAVNLAGVPVHARVGAADNVVHPFFSRRMCRLVGEGCTVEEVEGKGHWWWDTNHPNDGGVLNDGVMRATYEKALSSSTNPPASFTLVTTNVRAFDGTARQRGGISIMQLAGSEARIEAHILDARGSRVWRLVTRGARRLRFELRGSVPPSVEETTLCNFESGSLAARETTRARPSSLCVDGAAFKVSACAEMTLLHLCLIDSTWRVCFESKCAESDRASVGGLGDVALSQAGGEFDFEKFERGPHNSGFARAVFAAPFIIVSGTGGGVHASARRADAASALSQLFALASHAPAPVVFDTDVEHDFQGANMILLGGPEVNSLTARLVARPDFRCGVKFSRNVSSFSIGGVFFAGEKHALLTTAGFFDGDAMQARLALILGGNADHALDSLLALATPVPPPMVRAPFSNAVPDFIVFGPRAVEKGMGDVVAAGVWDSSWAVDRVVSFVKGLSESWTAE